MLRRALAHRVVHRGRVYRLSVVDISKDEIVIVPFKEETAATPFVDGTVFVLSQRYSRNGLLLWADDAGEAVLGVWSEIVDKPPFDGIYPELI